MSDLTGELLDALGIEGFIALTEAHGGIRLYVPVEPHGSQLATDIGLDHAARLSKLFPGSYIRVPLAREVRAQHYRALGKATVRLRAGWV